VTFLFHFAAKAGFMGAKTNATQALALIGRDKMKHFAKAVAALAISTGAAHAGGVDRSGQPIGFMFEKGNYAELSYGSVRPSVTADGNPYGNMAETYSTLGAAFKMDINDKLSLGLNMDQPYGANVRYSSLDFAATLNATAINAIARYKLNNSVSLHGGLSYTSLDGLYNPATTLGSVTTIERTSNTGYLVGAAWEKPEIAARVALTYFSGTNLVDPISNSSFNAPQAVNLDFQTGIAADTLVFGSVRWVDWSQTKINISGADVVTYSQDSNTFNLGVGRKFSDSWSGAVTVGYEAAQGGTASGLAPTDGNTSLGLGLTYTMDNIKITGGMRFVQLGDATTTMPPGNWTGNTATAAGLKVAFTF
jgi:long-chain fatty acid transport protein